MTILLHFYVNRAALTFQLNFIFFKTTLRSFRIFGAYSDTNQSFILYDNNKLTNSANTQPFNEQKALLNCWSNIFLYNTFVDQFFNTPGPKITYL